MNGSPASDWAALRDALAARRVPRHYARALLTEFEDHVAQRVADLRAEGTSAEEARARAVEELGDPGDLASRAAVVARRVPHRLPLVVFVLGPLVMFAALAAVLLPGLIAGTIGFHRLGAGGEWVPLTTYGSAVLIAGFLISRLARLAPRYPGVDPYVVAGGLALATTCALLHVTLATDGVASSLRIVYEPHRELGRGIATFLAVAPIAPWRLLRAKREG
ncbi:MAG: permease prefix domain 1-containing protein [bacterium]